MNHFTYRYPVKVYFGENIAKESLKSELTKHGKNVLFAYGGGSIQRVGIYDEMIAVLKEADKNIIEFSGIMPNPTYEKVQEGAKLARNHKIDFILAVGGGSVIDCCKIVSAQAKLDSDIWDFEYAQGGKPKDFIPMGAVVTAFGTGAEMNNGAVITNGEKKRKSPLWGAFYDFAVLDVDYTMTMPLKQVISGSFDTLSHCMETYFGTPREDNLSDEINEAVMRNVIKNIRSTLKNPNDKLARSELIWAAAMSENGILKLGKVTDFQCHMLEHQLGAYTDCNHGFGLAVIHPVLYKHIYKNAVERFAHFAESVWKIERGNMSDDELALAGINALADFIREIGLPAKFSDMGIADTDYEAIAQSTITTAGCPKKLTADELLEILNECQ